MANITQLIKNIREAIFGKDVRESIASAIEQCYEDASEHGNANMEVIEARGNFNTLKKRLDSIDNSKADKIELKSEKESRVSADNDLQNQINSLASGSPLVADSTSEMTDTSKIYVNTTDGHWYWYDGSNWVDGGVYQATSDSQIVGEQLYNSTPIDLNENQENGYFRPHDGVLSEFVEALHWQYTFFDVTPNENYNIKLNHSQTISLAYVYAVDDNLNIIEGFLANPNKENATDEEMITIPQGATKLYLQSSATSETFDDLTSCEKIQFVTHAQYIKNVEQNLNDVEQNLNDGIEIINNKINDINNLNNIPSYYNTMLYTKEMSINDLINDCLNGDQFIFITDYHYEDNANNSPKLINHILKNTGVRKVFNGGDIIDVFNNSPQTAIQKICEFNHFFDFLKFNQYFQIIGNHEYNDPSASLENQRLSLATVYGLTQRNTEYNHIHNKRTAFYIDNETQKIRYFFIGCNYNATIDLQDIQWIADKLQESNGYKVCVISHVGTKTTLNDYNYHEITGLNTNMRTLCYILAYFKNHKAKNNVYDSGISIDFTNLTETDVIGVISGHSHVDGYYEYTLAGADTVTTFPVIATTCDSYDRELGNLDRQLGNTSEQAFDIFTIDINNRKIYATRIGAGQDREFDF